MRRNRNGITAAIIRDFPAKLPERIRPRLALFRLQEHTKFAADRPEGESWQSAAFNCAMAVEVVDLPAGLSVRWRGQLMILLLSIGYHIRGYQQVVTYICVDATSTINITVRHFSMLAA